MGLETSGYGQDIGDYYSIQKKKKSIAISSTKKGGGDNRYIDINTLTGIATIDTDLSTSIDAISSSSGQFDIFLISSQLTIINRFDGSILGIVDREYSSPLNSSISSDLCLSCDDQNIWTKKDVHKFNLNFLLSRTGIDINTLLSDYFFDFSAIVQYSELSIWPDPFPIDCLNESECGQLWPSDCFDHEDCELYQRFYLGNGSEHLVIPGSVVDALNKQSGLDGYPVSVSIYSINGVLLGKEYGLNVQKYIQRLLSQNAIFKLGRTSPCEFVIVLLN